MSYSKIAIIGASRRKVSINDMIKENLKVEVEDNKSVDFSNVIENVNNGYRPTYRKHRLPITKVCNDRLVTTVEADITEPITTSKKRITKREIKKLLKEKNISLDYYETLLSIEVVSNMEEYIQFMEEHTIAGEDDMSITFHNKTRSIVRCFPKAKHKQKTIKK